MNEDIQSTSRVIHMNEVTQQNKPKQNILLSSNKTN